MIAAAPNSLENLSAPFEASEAAALAATASFSLSPFSVFASLSDAEAYRQRATSRIHSRQQAELDLPLRAASSLSDAALAAAEVAISEVSKMAKWKAEWSVSRLLTALGVSAAPVCSCSIQCPQSERCRKAPGREKAGNPTSVLMSLPLRDGRRTRQPAHPARNSMAQGPAGRQATRLTHRGGLPATCPLPASGRFSGQGARRRSRCRTRPVTPRTTRQYNVFGPTAPCKTLSRAAKQLIDPRVGESRASIDGHQQSRRICAAVETVITGLDAGDDPRRRRPWRRRVVRQPVGEKGGAA